MTANPSRLSSARPPALLPERLTSQCLFVASVPMLALCVRCCSHRHKPKHFHTHTHTQTHTHTHTHTNTHTHTSSYDCFPALLAPSIAPPSTLTPQHRSHCRCLRSSQSPARCEQRIWRAVNQVHARHQRGHARWKGGRCCAEHRQGAPLVVNCAPLFSSL